MFVAAPPTFTRILGSIEKNLKKDYEEATVGNKSRGRKSSPRKQKKTFGQSAAGAAGRGDDDDESPDRALGDGVSMTANPLQYTKSAKFSGASMGALGADAADVNSGLDDTEGHAAANNLL